MFIATLFIIAKICKQPKCQSTDEQIEEKWYIRIMGFPGGSYSKESACNVGDPGSCLGQEDHLEMGMTTPAVFLPRV